MHRHAARSSHTWDKNDGKIIPVKWFLSLWNRSTLRVQTPSDDIHRQRARGGVRRTLEIPEIERAHGRWRGQEQGQRNWHRP